MSTNTPVPKKNRYIRHSIIHDAKDILSELMADGHTDERIRKCWKMLNDELVHVGHTKRKSPHTHTHKT